MPITTADDEEIQIHVAPTLFDDKEKNNRFRFAGRHRRRSSFGSLASSVGSFGGLMDMFGPAEPKSPDSDDNIAPRRHEIDDPEETFARAAPENRYDPSRLTVADFDLDGMNDDDSASLPGLDESYVIDEATGQRFCVPSTTSSNKKKKKKKEKRSSHPLVKRYTFPSPSSFCKQLIGIATVPLLILSSAGLLVFAFMITKSSDSSSALQTDSGDRSGIELLLYNTELAVDKACTKENPDWENLTHCRELCRNNMCCFEVSSSNRCYRGNERSCLAHSACTTLQSFPSQITKPYNTEKEKLVLSEMILLACSREKLDTDMSSCQRLCKNMLCCFDEEEDYNCASVKGEECLVHAACEALVAGH